MSAKIDFDSDSKKLFFKDFTQKLLFCFIYQVSSLRSLSLELKTNQVCKHLDLEYTPFSTLKDGFKRFDSIHYKTIFQELVKKVPLFKVPYLEEMGIFKLLMAVYFLLLFTCVGLSIVKIRMPLNCILVLS